MAKHSVRYTSQKPSVLRQLFPSLVINVVCPVVAYSLLQPHFSKSSVVPLALSSLFPIVGVAVGFLRQGVLDVIGLFALIEIGVDITALLLAKNTMFALVGRSLDKAVLGILYLLSLSFSRPFMFYVARQFIAGNDADHVRRFNNTMNYPFSRTVFRRLTVVWGVVFLAESVLRVVLALTLSVPAYLAISPSVGYSVYIGLTVWSIAYGRRVIPQIRAEMYPTSQGLTDQRE